MLTQLVKGVEATNLTYTRTLDLFKSGLLEQALTTYVDMWNAYVRRYPTYDSIWDKKRMDTHESMLSLMYNIPEFNLLKNIASSLNVQAMLSADINIELCNLVQFVDTARIVASGDSCNYICNIFDRLGQFKDDPYNVYINSHVPMLLDCMMCKDEGVGGNDLYYYAEFHIRDSEDDMVGALRDKVMFTRDVVTKSHPSWEFTRLLNNPRGKDAGLSWLLKGGIPPYTREQIEWCRKYAPVSFCNLSDEELWKEMWSTYTRLNQ